MEGSGRSRRQKFSASSSESALFMFFLNFFCQCVSPPNCLMLYLVQLAFLTIARCGFGMSLNYAEDANANIDQHNNTANDMTVEKGFGVISETIVQRLAFPKWFYKLPIQKSVYIYIHFLVVLPPFNS